MSCRHSRRAFAHPNLVGCFVVLLGACSCARPISELGPSRPAAVRQHEEAKTTPDGAGRSSAPGQSCLGDERGGEVDVARLETLALQLAELRGYDQPITPSCRWVTPEQWPTVMAEELDALVPRDLDRQLDEALVSFGLLPKDFDSREQLLERLQSTVEGLYLTSSRQIALPSGKHAGRLRSDLLLHELTHAQQDLRYGLGQRLRYRPESSDEISALHALAEGEAMLVEVLTSRPAAEPVLLPPFELIEEAFETTSASWPLPPLTRRSLIAPYLDGYRFVAYVWQTGGWQLLDRVWQRGLGSTQELLHPEAWLQGGTAQTGELSHAAGTIPRRLPSPLGGKEVEAGRFSDSLGEQGLRLILEEGLAKAGAADLARHLEGDRLTSYQVETEQAFVWQLHFADGTQIQPICQALEQTLSRGAAKTRRWGCVKREGAIGAIDCGKRDTLVLFRSHAVTWTDNAAEATCGAIRGWLRDQVAPLESKHL